MVFILFRTLFSALRSHRALAGCVTWGAHFWEDREGKRKGVSSHGNSSSQREVRACVNKTSVKIETHRKRTRLRRPRGGVKVTRDPRSVPAKSELAEYPRPVTRTEPSPDPNKGAPSVRVPRLPNGPSEPNSNCNISVRWAFWAERADAVTI